MNKSKALANDYRPEILVNLSSPVNGYDFIHKMKVALKELRETRVWLLMIKKAKLIEPSKLESLLDESNQLLSIFVTSLKTAMAKEK